MTKKNILITGAGKRIGKELAINFLSKGHNVVIHCNNLSEAEEASLNQVNDLEGKAFIIKSNLIDTEKTKQLIEQSKNKFGKIDLLINNASSFINDSSKDFSHNLMHDQINVNLISPLILCREFFVNLSQDNTEANIINILDYCVLVTINKFFSYATSRAALWHATKQMALEMAPKVRVNAIAIGKALKGSRESESNFTKSINASLLQRATTLDEIVATIDFLLSTKSITGQLIALDSGKHLMSAEYC